MASRSIAMGLLRGAAAELQRLRVVRGTHRRTDRQRRAALLAFAMALHLIPNEASGAELSFFGGFHPDLRGRTPTLADIDGDGDVDALFSEGGQAFLVENTGGPSRLAFADHTQDPFGLLLPGLTSPLAVVDIDGDGDQDVFAGFSGETYFYENTGTATVPAFGIGLASPFGLPDVGSWAEPSFADTDGDGDLDALVGTSGGNTQFFENTGTVTAPAFGPATASPFGLESPASGGVPRLVDIDDDGDLDAFRTRSGPGGPSFQENTGSSLVPTFALVTQAPFALPQTRWGTTLDVADLDGDGDFDIILLGDDDEIGLETRSGVLLANTGTSATPRFASPTPSKNPFGLPDFFYESVLRFADIDGDGDYEAFVGEYEGYVWQLHNGGTPQTPRLGAGNPFGIGAHDARGQGRVALVDIDGDGDLDVFVGGDYDGRVRFFENTGAPLSPSFAVELREPFGLVGRFSYGGPAFVDIDGDGDEDAFLGNNGFFRNTGSASAPAFVLEGQLAQPASHGSFDPVRFVDIDGDGDPDQFVFDGGVYLSENTGTATAPAFASSVADPFGLAIPDAEHGDFGDLDGDGDLDALIGDEHGVAWWAENVGTSSVPTFSAPTTLPFGLTKFPEHVAPNLADIDGDGDLDAFLATLYGFVAFFENTGSPSAPAFSPGVHAAHLVPKVYSYSGPSFADIDGDGDLDALVGDSYGDTILFANTGTPSTPAMASASTNPFGLVRNPNEAWTRPAFGDIDGDGDLDAMIGDNYGDLYFSSNTGSSNAPAFAAPTPFPFGLIWTDYNAAPELVDLDEDGDLDLVNGDYYGNAVFFENTGAATSPAFAAPVFNPYGIPRVYKKTSPTFVDIDGDGDLDYFAGVYFGQTYFARNGISVGAAPMPFLEYKVKEGDRTGENGILPSTCNLTIDDPLFDFGSGPSAENYRVSLVRTLSLPADREGSGATDLDATRLLGLLIRGSAKGALPPSSGQFTPARKHAKRTGVFARILDPHLHDGSGRHTVRVDTKKETRLLIPTGHAVGGVPAPATGITNAYKCYKVKASGGGSDTGSLQDVKGKEQRNLQVVLEDGFADGQGHPLFGDGRRFDLRNVVELCNPVKLSNVDQSEQDATGATRSSTCETQGYAIAQPATSLLCWRIRSSRLVLEQPWTFQAPPLPIDPKQEKHRKRLHSKGEGVHLDHDLEAPDVVNTAKEAQVCFPADITDPGTIK